MPKKHPSVINIKVIQKEFLLDFIQIMTIIKKENWIPVGKRMRFDREQVYSYFANKGIAQKAISYLGICEKFGVSKEDAFKIIHEQKWKPIIKGAVWYFAFAPIAEYFKNK
jgi:hypothetical protein